MAKRRRLDPFAGFGDDPGPAAPPPAPIARVTGEAAREAAFDEMAETLRRARAEGLLIRKLPLEAVEAEHLLRDRIGLDEAEMAPLVESLRARGQQVPIEVAELAGDRFGLISGWRRLAALRRLHAETGEARFATVLAILRHPPEASDAYVAMVEENEIRLGLSYYERARIVARTVEAGVFPDAQTALRTLFASGSRARRSKIGSFLALVRTLEGGLRFPAAIGERLGLALAQRIETDPGFAESLRARLSAADPADAGAEASVLGTALRAGAARTPDAQEEPAPGIRLKAGPRRVTLSGPGVDAAFLRRLRGWLATGGA